MTPKLSRWLSQIAPRIPFLCLWGMCLALSGLPAGCKAKPETSNLRALGAGSLPSITTLDDLLNAVADLLLLIAAKDWELLDNQLVELHTATRRREQPKLENILPRFDLQRFDKQLTPQFLKELGRDLDRLVDGKHNPQEKVQSFAQDLKGIIDEFHEVADEIDLDNKIIREWVRELVKIPKDGLTEQDTELLNALIPSYFLKLPSRNRLRMISDLIRHRPKETKEFVALVVMRSGPIVQKVFQQVADSLPDLQGSADLLKNFLPAMHPKVVEKKLQQGLGEHRSKLKIEPTPIGRATMAQVHRARFGSRTVAVKILRRGIYEEATQEKQLILGLLGADSPVLSLVEAYADSVIEEADLMNEHNNIELAVNLNSGGVKTIQRVTAFPKNSDVVVMTWAEGQPYVSAFKDPQVVNHPSFRRSIKETMSANIRAALFKKGYFSTDVHSGNFFFHRDPVGGTFFTTVIDLGSLPHLKKNEQRGLTCLIVHASSKKVSVLSELIELLELGGTVSQSELKEFVESENSHLVKILNLFTLLIRKMNSGKVGVTSFLRMMGSTAKMLQDFNESVDPAAGGKPIELKNIVVTLFGKRPQAGYVDPSLC